MNYDPLSPNTLFMELQSSSVVCPSVIKLEAGVTHSAGWPSQPLHTYFAFETRL